MKKVLTIFGIMLITLFALTINAYAYTYSINLRPATTSLKAGDTVAVDIMVSSLALETNEAGIIGFEAGLEYDNKIFSKASVSGNGQWSEGENITKVKGIFFSNEVKATGKLATITLTVAEDVEVGETIVSLKNIKTANGTSDEVTTSDAVVILEVVEVEDSNDDNNENEDNKNDENKDNNGNDNNEENKPDNTDKNDDTNKEENKPNNTDKNDGTNKEENKEENKDTNKDENKNNTVNKNNTTKDNTVANKVISAAGLENLSTLVVGALVVIAGISYMSYKKYKNM